MSANEANWDQRTPVHLASSFYGVDGSREPESWFAGYEWEDLGELRGTDLAHLQCHLGVETVALARRGARVVGLDFSTESVLGARDVAERFGADVSYVRANVYDAVAAFGGRDFDVIYTGKGALCYLPDLPAWADVVFALLRPGGFVYLVEFHPLLYSLGVVPPADGAGEPLLRFDYLAGRGVEKRDATRTYTDGPALTSARVAYEWRHGIGDVVTALAAAGLTIEVLREDGALPWPRFGDMARGEDGWFRFPDSSPRIPLLYAIRARRPRETSA
ncbi:methyltransferase family protein [Actinophytocola oryzae]|uniref:Methyltransferase family protein n=2 Tax=Actinophytocola oryzae TaxID=502181 RepID=A0A4R7V952_9PSEU|nr:methyltransferase family protein [Actinophytocola oryzae]